MSTTASAHDSDVVELDIGDTALVARRSAEALTPWRDRFLEKAIAAEPGR